jgi:acetyl-CoA synthetase
VLRRDGTPADADESGLLVVNKPWPGMIRSIYGDKNKERMKEVYFSEFPGRYFTGDTAKVDKDGYFWIMGRADDVMNVSGHRLGTAEIESALVSHEAVAEAAVVGVPHALKGSTVYCFVTLKDGYDKSDALKKELVTQVREEISPIATPEYIQFTDALPKTRSGKIMRRVLKKITVGQMDDIGDTSTLADPKVVEVLADQRIPLKE